MNDQRVISTHFPYVPLHVAVRNRAENVEALLDTGFDGDIVVPEAFATGLGLPDSRSRWQLADGSLVRAPIYLGSVRIGRTELSPVLVIALGDELLVSRNLIAHFTVILDHGHQLTFEP